VIIWDKPVQFYEGEEPDAQDMVGVDE
jgi:hypothetical protein